nr:unnamed protein product [Digitaria exilis]
MLCAAQVRRGLGAGSEHGGSCGRDAAQEEHHHLWSSSRWRCARPLAAFCSWAISSSRLLSSRAACSTAGISARSPTTERFANSRS